MSTHKQLYPMSTSKRLSQGVIGLGPDWLPGCSATRPPSCDLLVIGCPDRCLDLALAMQKACGSLAQQIRGKRAFPRSLARAGATRAQARRKICPTHVHPPIQSLSPLSLTTKNRPTKLAYLACIGPGQPWPGSLMRARFTREVNQSDPKGFLCLHTSYTFVQAVGNAAARRATSRHDRTSSVPGHLMMIPR